MTLIQQALARIEEMEKRAEGVTPGPWQMVDGPFLDDCLLLGNGKVAEDFNDMLPADHRYICAARTDLPALCALLKAFLVMYTDAEDWSEAHHTPGQLAALKAFTEAR